jgi:hypothetical protein
MTSEGIGLSSRQVPLCNNIDLPLGAIEEEDNEVGELVQRDVTPTTTRF